MSQVLPGLAHVSRARVIRYQSPRGASLELADQQCLESNPTALADLSNTLVYILKLFDWVGYGASPSIFNNT
jgi:hypothetical protein